MRGRSHQPPSQILSAPEPGRSWGCVGAGEAGEGAEVRRALASLDPPRPFPADRGFEADGQRGVEVVIGVAEHTAEQPVDLLIGYRRQRLAPGQVDIALWVNREVDAVHPAVALEQEPVEAGVVFVR